MTTLLQWLVNNTNGTTVSTGNCLAVTGTAASTVSPGSGGTITYSSTVAHQGSTSVRFVGGGTATQALRLPFAAANAAAAFSFYHRSASLPSAATDILNVRSSGGALFRVSVNGSGAINVRTTTPSSIVGTANGRWAINRWNRIEVVFDNSGGTSAGVVTLTVFDTDNTTPLETITSSTANLGSAAATSIDFGTPNLSSSTWTHYIDSIQLADGATSTIGPYQVSSATATLTGSGTLSATASAIEARTAGFTGSGTLSASAFASFSRNAVKSASGTLSAAVVEIQSRSASFSGVGALGATAAIVQREVRDAEFTGSGTLSVTVLKAAARVAHFTSNLTLGVSKISSSVIPPPTFSYWEKKRKDFGQYSERLANELKPFWYQSDSVGVHVVRYTDGTFSTVPVVTEEMEATEGLRIYYGGKKNVVTADEAEELIAAGYADYVVYPGYGAGQYGSGAYGVPQEGG